MKAASLNEIKQELQNLSAKENMELCLRLAKYKKENKELLSYLLFQAQDEEAYIKQVQQDMAALFNDVHTSNLYLAKKTLRKILRFTNRCIRYTTSKQTEAELRMFFCTLLKNSGIALHKNKALHNMYLQQVKKIKPALDALHEDIQYDYKKQLEALQETS